MLLRHFWVESIIGVLLVASAYALLEVILTILHEIGPDKLTEIPALPMFPRPLNYVILILGFLMFRHRLQEWRLRKREDKLPAAVQVLLRRMTDLKAAGAATERARSDFLESFMERFMKVLEAGGRRRILISLMEPNNDGKLAITFKHPEDARLDEELRLEKGKGGAGLAWQEEEPVYIPSIRHRIGIKLVGQPTPLGFVYVESKSDPFRSLLCVPLFTDSKFLGVLNFHSDQRSAFLESDFAIAKMAAAFLTLFMFK